MSAARWIVAGLVVAVLVAPLTIAVAGLSGMGHRWVDILAQFVAPALIATLLLALTLTAARLWRLAAGAGAVALALLIAIWPEWAPTRGRPVPEAPVLTLYSANLWFQNTEVEKVRASVAQANPDIVILIETNPAIVDRIDAVLAAYPHRVASPAFGQPSPNRTVIASRYPVTVLTDRPDGLNDLPVRIDTPLGPLTVVGVHLTRPWPFQFQWGQITQVMALQDIVTGLDGPVIAAGDFNSVSGARIGRQVQADLGLSPAPGWPGTWPAALPSALGITIDQVYRSPDLALTGRRLGRPTGSDHRPVVTRFTLARPEPAP